MQKKNAQAAHLLLVLLFWAVISVPDKRTDFFIK